MRTKKDIETIVRAAYHWGRDNGESRSEKNLNDFKETSLYKKLIEEKPLLEDNYYIVQVEEGMECEPAKCIFNMIEQEKYFKFFNGAEMPCRIVFDYYSI